MGAEMECADGSDHLERPRRGGVDLPDGAGNGQTEDAEREAHP